MSVWMRFLNIALLTCSLVPNEKFYATRSRGTQTRKESTYLSVVRDKRVGIIHVLLDDEVTLFLDLLIALPVGDAPPEFGEEGVIPVPRLKVESTPHAAFLGPKGADALEYVTACIEGRVDALEALVVLFDLLSVDQKGQIDKVRYRLTLRAFRRPSRVLKCTGDTCLRLDSVRRQSE